SQSECVKAHAAANLSRSSAPVSIVDGNTSFSVAGQNPNRGFHHAVAQIEFDDIDKRLPMLSAGAARSLIEPQLARKRGTDEDGVVPSKLRDRLGQLLQPTVVGKTTIEDGRIGMKHNLKRFLRRASSW